VSWQNFKKAKRGIPTKSTDGDDDQDDTTPKRKPSAPHRTTSSSSQKRRDRDIYKSSITRGKPGKGKSDDTNLPPKDRNSNSEPRKSEGSKPTQKLVGNSNEERKTRDHEGHKAVARKSIQDAPAENQQPNASDESLKASLSPTQRSFLEMIEHLEDLQKKIPLAPPKIIYLLKRVTDPGWRERVLRLLDRLGRGYPHQFEMLLDELVKQNDEEHVMVVLDRMRKSLQPPTQGIYNSLVVLYARTKNSEKMSQMLLQLRENEMDLTDRALKAILVSCEDDKEFEEIVEGMRQRNMTPDVHMLAVRQAFYLRRGTRVEELKQVLKEAAALKYVPISQFALAVAQATLHKHPGTTLADVQARKENVNWLLEFLESRKEDKPSEGLVIGLLKLARAGPDLHRHFERVRKWVVGYRAKLPCDLVDEGVIAQLILRCRQSNFDPSTGLEWCREAGVTPGVKVFNALLALAKERHDVINSLLGKMKTAELTPDLETWHLLIKSKIRRGEVDAAFGVLERMKTEGSVKPTASTLKLLGRVCASARDVKKAMEVWKMMKAEGLPCTRTEYLDFILPAFLPRKLQFRGGKPRELEPSDPIKCVQELEQTGGLRVGPGLLNAIGHQLQANNEYQFMPALMAAFNARKQHADVKLLSH